MIRWKKYMKTNRTGYSKTIILSIKATGKNYIARKYMEKGTIYYKQRFEPADKILELIPSTSNQD